MIVQSRVLPVEALKINLWSVRYEAAGDTAHRKFTAPVTAPADYANRHIVMAGALAIRNLATGQKDLLPAGRVWPFAGITGDRIDVVAQEPDTLWMCVRIKPGSGYRVDHSEETFDLGAIVNCSGAVAVLFPAQGEPSVIICETERLIPVKAGDRLVRFFPTHRDSRERNA